MDTLYILCFKYNRIREWKWECFVISIKKKEETPA